MDEDIRKMPRELLTDCYLRGGAQKFPELLKKFI